ncbi:hypothetical protein [Vibrio harveyi]
MFNSKENKHKLEITQKEFIENNATILIYGFFVGFVIGLFVDYNVV